MFSIHSRHCIDCLVMLHNFIIRRFGFLLFFRTVYPFYQPSEKPTTTSRGTPARFGKIHLAGADVHCNGTLKVWPVVHDSRELRVLVLNKNESFACNVLLYLTEPFKTGRIQRMNSDPNFPVNVTDQVGLPQPYKCALVMHTWLCSKTHLYLGRMQPLLALTGYEPLECDIVSMFKTSYLNL